MSTEPRDHTDRFFRAPWWLYIALLLLISAKIIEIAVTLNDFSALNSLPLPFSPIVSIIFAGVWLVLLIVLSMALLRRANWSFRWIVPLLTLYALTHLIWQILFFRSDFDRGRLGFQIIINMLLVLPLWVIAWQRRWLGRPATV